MSNLQRASDGKPLGNLQAFSVNAGLNSPYPTDGTGTVPSMNTTVLSDNAYELHFESGETAVLSTDLPAGSGGSGPGGSEHIEQFKGIVAGVNTSAGSPVATLQLDSEARKFNQEIAAYPIVDGGVHALRQAIRHYMFECGMNQWHPTGQMEAVYPVAEGGYGWFNSSKRNRPYGFVLNPASTRTWSTTAGTRERIKMVVGDELHFVTYITRTNTTGTSQVFSFHDPTRPNLYVGSVRVTANDTSVVVEAVKMNATYQTLATLTVPTGWTGMHIEVSLKPTSATNYRYMSKAVYEKAGITTGTTTTTSNVSVSATGGESDDSAYAPGNLMVGAASVTVTGTGSVRGAYIVRTTDWLPSTSVDLSRLQEGLLPDITVPSGVTVNVPGFKGNAWQQINDLCSIYGVVFDPLRMSFTRSTDVYVTEGTFGNNQVGPSVESQVRELAETIEVVSYNYDAKASNGELWRADTVYTLGRGERQDHVISVEGYVVSLTQPTMMLPSAIPVSTKGKATGSYYSVYGDDKNPVTVSEWQGSGGFVRVELTDNPSEFKLILQAPSEILTAAYPYHISLETSMPSLVISGRGLLSNKKTLTAYTGAGKVPVKVGTTYDNPLVCGDWLGWNVAMGLSVLYGTTLTQARGNFVPYFNAESGHMGLPYYIKKEGALYRTTSGTVTHGGSSVSNAVRYVRCKDVNEEYAGMTCAQVNALFAGKNVRYNNLAPLKRGFID